MSEWPGDTPLTYNLTEDGAALGRKIEYDDVTSAYVAPTKLFNPPELQFHESPSKNP